MVDVTRQVEDCGIILICVTWLIHVRDMTHGYVWYDSFVTREAQDCGRSQHGVFICVTWRIHTCDMTHSYMWHVWFKTHQVEDCGTSQRGVVCEYLWHDSFISVTWLTRDSSGGGLRQITARCGHWSPNRPSDRCTGLYIYVYVTVVHWSIVGITSSRWCLVHRCIRLHTCMHVYYIMNSVWSL